MFEITAWYCNDCGGNFLEGHEPVTCKCGPTAQKYSYTVIGGGGGGCGSGKTHPEPDYDFRRRLDDELVRRGLNPDSPNLKTLVDAVSTAQGIELDRLAQTFGIMRHPGVDPFGASLPPGMQQMANPHADHEVVENHAGGKSFKYCRNCKVEVT